MSVLSLRAKTAIAVMHRISTKPHPSCALYSTLNKLLVNKLLQESSKGQNALIGVPTPESIMSSPDFNSPLAIRSFFHLTGLNTGKPVQSQVINDDAHLSNLSSKSQPSGHPGTGGIGNPQRDYDQQISDKAEQHGIESALHKLNLNVQRTGRAYLDHVLSIFAGIKRCGGCTPNEALLLLRCCGNFLTDEKVEIRAALSEELWAYYQNKGIELDTSHYNALLKNRLDNGDLAAHGLESAGRRSSQDIKYKKKRKGRKSLGKKGHLDFAPGSYSRRIISTYNKAQKFQLGSIVGHHIPLSTEKQCVCDHAEKVR